MATEAGVGQRSSRGLAAGRYAKLANWLQAQAHETVSLSFAEIHRILGTPLPASARRYQAFWSSGNHLGKILKTCGWRARPVFSQQLVHFRRCEVDAPHAPASRSANPMSRPPARISSPDVILIGCVKGKRPGRHPVRDLYISPLFERRKAYAERAGVPWFVLSAKYGLLSPDEEVDSYDLNLSELPFPERRAWARRVVEALERAVGSLAGKRVEIHAGGRYRHSGLVAELRMRGAVVAAPLAHLRIGEQMTWYERIPTVEQTGADGASGSVHSDMFVARLVERVTADFVEGKLDLSARVGAPVPGWDAMPEVSAVRRLEEMGVDPLRQRLFLMLIAALDRARDADRLWKAGVDLYEKAPWVFEPEEVQRRSLRELRQRLVETGVAQRPLIDSAAWKLIAEALKHREGPPMIWQAVCAGKGDALKLIEELKTRDSAGQPWFPYLCGPKVSAVWVRMLVVPGKADIRNIDAIPVAVDVHLRRVTKNLGLVDTHGQKMTKAVRAEIQEIWCRGSSAAEGPGSLRGTCAALDPALWFIGKWGCAHCERIGRRAPISDVCANCRLPG